MNSERKSVINVITSPLGFFALALLIVEGFLTIVLVFSKDSCNLNFDFWGMIIGAVLFVLVLVLVWIVVWDRPKHLTMEGKHYKEIMEKTIELEKASESLAKNTKDKKYH